MKDKATLLAEFAKDQEDFHFLEVLTDIRDLLASVEALVARMAQR